jgi:hypothetical protein
MAEWRMAGGPYLDLSLEMGVPCLDFRTWDPSDQQRIENRGFPCFRMKTWGTQKSPYSDRSP